MVVWEGTDESLLSPKELDETDGNVKPPEVVENGFHNCCRSMGLSKTTTSVYFHMGRTARDYYVQVVSIVSARRLRHHLGAKDVGSALRLPTKINNRLPDSKSFLLFLTSHSTVQTS